MSDMKFFQSSNGCKVRVFIRDGEPWFLTKDVCSNLGIANTGDAISRLKDSQKDVIGNTDVTGRHQEMSIVSESGLYKLIMQSRKPEAEKFQDWVTCDVLPAIRKNGVYATPEAVSTLDPEELMARAIITAQETIKRLEFEKAEAIREKGRISSSREASMMAKYGAAKRENQSLRTENEELKDKLGCGPNGFTVANIPYVRKYFYLTPYRGTLKVQIYNRLGTALSILCREMGIDPQANKTISDDGRSVNVYPKVVVDTMESLVLTKDYSSKSFRMVCDYLRKGYQ